MRRTSFLLAGLLSAAPACGPAQQDPMPSRPLLAARQEALRALARATGTAWRVRYDAALGTAAFLEGRTAPLATLDRIGTAARDFLLRYRDLFGLGEGEELAHLGSDLDALGMRHVRFAQARGRVPVWGSALTVHLDKDGALLRVTGRAVPLPPLPAAELVPALSGEEARQAALDHVQDERPEAAIGASAPDLWLLPGEGGARLCWRSEVEGQEGAQPLRREVFVAARGEVAGQVIAEADLLAFLNLPVPAVGSGLGALGERRALSLTGRGDRYYMEDPRRGKLRTTVLKVRERLPGTTVSSKQVDDWGAAPVAVDVHAHLGAAWDYFGQAHRRYGAAGDGRGPVAVALVPDPRLVGAFDGRRLLFGAGDGAALAPPGAAVEIVAHEYTHAVVRALSGLRPDGESGAIDEGTADLFACFVKQAAAPGRSPWTIGEGVYRPGGTPTPLRDLSDPRRGDQVRSLSEIADQGAPIAPRAPLDREQVRARAGIVSHAGFVIASRVGAPAAAAIWYRAIGTYLHQFAGFSDAADALLAAAQDLHGEGSAAAAAVREAWSQAGVGGIETIGESARP